MEHMNIPILAIDVMVAWIVDNLKDISTKNKDEAKAYVRLGLIECMTESLKSEGNEV